MLTSRIFVSRKTKKSWNHAKQKIPDFTKQRPVFIEDIALESNVGDSLIQIGLNIGCNLVGWAMSMFSEKQSKFEHFFEEPKDRSYLCFSVDLQSWQIRLSQVSQKWTNFSLGWVLQRRSCATEAEPPTLWFAFVDWTSIGLILCPFVNFNLLWAATHSSHKCSSQSWQ